jgi:hypothetical protein
MNIYSKLALASAQSSVLLASLGILGITPPAVASSLTFEVSGDLASDSSPFPSLGGTFVGTFSYDPEAADLIPEPRAGRYPISEFSIILRDLLGNQIEYVVDSDDETCNCFISTSFNGNDYDFASLTISPNHSIVLNFFDGDSFFNGFRSLYINRSISLSFAYEGMTDILPSTTEEFLANLGNFPRGDQRFYDLDVSGLRGRTLFARNATITTASQPVPEPSGVGAFSLLSLSFFLKKKKISSRKAIAISESLGE